MEVEITDTTWSKVEQKEYYFSDLNQWQPINSSNFKHTFERSGNYKIIQKLYAPSGCVIVTDSVLVAVSKGLNLSDTFNLWLSDVTQGGILLDWKSNQTSVNYKLYSGEDVNNLSLLIETTDTFYLDKRQPVFPYYYKINAVDSCGTEGVQGYHSQPSWLSGVVKGNNDAAELHFTDYTVWSGKELEYHLQKRKATGWTTINSSANNYTDNEFLIEGSLQSCYRVLLIDLSNPQLISHSNEVCLDYILLLYIPNAFSPNGDG